MGSFIKGDVVVIPFPFSDLSENKKRPALVLATLDGDDVVLCQITSKTRHDAYSIALTENDFASGSLRQDSLIRPNRIFTADTRIVLYKAGMITDKKVDEVVDRLISILKT